MLLLLYIPLFTSIFLALRIFALNCLGHMFLHSCFGSLLVESLTMSQLVCQRVAKLTWVRAFPSYAAHY